MNSGHLQALVNPPDPGSRRTYRVADAVPPSPEAWLAGAAEHKGSWWPDYLSWLEPRSGERKPKPKTLGRKQHKPIVRGPRHVRLPDLMATAHLLPSQRRDGGGMREGRDVAPHIHGRRLGGQTDPRLGM